MIHDVTRRLAEVVTNHHRLVILLVIVLTAGVAFGLTQDASGPDQAVDDEALGDTEVFQAGEYIAERYGSDEESDLVSTNVYMRADDGSVLTREALLAGLEYQMAAKEHPDVAADLAEDGIQGPPNIVAQQLAEDPEADLEAQHAALTEASDEEVASIVAATFVGGEETRFYLPSSYETGSSEAEGLRMTFTFEQPDADGHGVSEEAQKALYETAQDHDDPAVFTTGQFAMDDMFGTFLGDTAWLIMPPILLMLVIVLGFAYRDMTDVAIGFIGTVLSLVWAAGLMGWMGLLNQQTAIIVPVLIAALSIDFGFHVFMRYRERRQPEEAIRAALSRSMAAVAIAFSLVTITAAVGFLSNLTSPVPLIRQLGIAITLGVVATMFIFVTIVPALKVSADGLWERFGFNRHKPALGKGRYLSRILGLGATAATRAAVPVIVLALVLGLAGGAAFVELDREPFQEGDFDEVPEWQTELPGPMAFEAHESEPVERFTYAQDRFQADQEGFAEGGTGFTQMLVEGENGVASPEAMTALAAGEEAAQTANNDVVLRQGDAVHVVSPLSMMEALAEQDDEFAATFDAADSTGDGVPDQNIESLFDAFYATAPDQAAQVLERTEDGEYASMLLMVPAQSGFGSERADTMHGIAEDMEAASGHDVTAVGIATTNEAEMDQITEGIVMTLGIAMLGVLLILSLVFRVVRGSATLGAVTVLPIALALGLVFGGMYLLGEPLTLLTALLVSITIGLGIDYNIHLSDRYAEERARGHDTPKALREAVTGTGGALLGSAVTSGSAFGLMILIPEPQLSSFGVIVALALVACFLLSVFVLPSLLYLQEQWKAIGRTHPTSSVTASDD